jgi:hypothetical protein
MKLMPKTACDNSCAHDAKGRLASAVPVYHYYLQDHLENPGLSMIQWFMEQMFGKSHDLFELIWTLRCMFDLSTSLFVDTLRFAFVSTP